jgi:hypothetical protein
MYLGGMQIPGKKRAVRGRFDGIVDAHLTLGRWQSWYLKLDIHLRSRQTVEHGLIPNVRFIAEGRTRAPWHLYTIAGHHHGKSNATEIKSQQLDAPHA